MKLFFKSGSNVDVYSKAETNARLSTKQNLISTSALTIANGTNLQTELNARPLSPSVNSKTEIETMISNLIDNADVNINTLNEITNAINNDPVFLSKSGINARFRNMCKTLKYFQNIPVIRKL